MSESVHPTEEPKKTYSIMLQRLNTVQGLLEMIQKRHIEVIQDWLFEQLKDDEAKND